MRELKKGTTKLYYSNKSMKSLLGLTFSSFRVHDQYCI